MLLTQSKLRRLLDPERIASAIHDAESHCTAEIRVSVSGAWWGDPHKMAERAFIRMGMARTEQRNGVLFFVMPFRRRFAVIGDSGIHAAVGQAFWDEVTTAMGARFRAGDVTGALEHGIAEAGHHLAIHFPAPNGGNPNELPDQVDLGG